MAIRTLAAGDNGLAAFNGELTFSGDPEATYGTVKLAAQRVAAGRPSSPSARGWRANIARA